MNTEQEYLVELLQNAIKAVYDEERFLLSYSEGDRKGMEQAFVFRTGIHLNTLLNGTIYSKLDLDSEYNRNQNALKTTARSTDGTRPDLIIHQRTSNEENKLIAEFKGWWNNDIVTDIQKLEDFTNPNDEYHYLIGVLVQIGKTKATFRYFINGAEIWVSGKK